MFNNNFLDMLIIHLTKFKYRHTLFTKRTSITNRFVSPQNLYKKECKTVQKYFHSNTDSAMITIYN